MTFLRDLVDIFKAGFINKNLHQNLALELKKNKLKSMFKRGLLTVYHRVNV